MVGMGGLVGVTSEIVHERLAFARELADLGLEFCCELVDSDEEQELLEGMCNCFSACGADFDGTVSMVAGARGRAEEDVKETLRAMATSYAQDGEYQGLRSRLPAEFPF